MGRKNSETWGTIHSICEAAHIDEKRLYEKLSSFLVSIGNSAGRRNPKRMRLSRIFAYVQVMM